MTTEQKAAHDREILLDQQATTAKKTVKNSCPFYRFKEEEGKVTSCDGDVVFVAGEGCGVCQDCGREVPLFLEV